MFRKQLIGVCLVCVSLAGPVFAEPLTLPDDQRPEWLRRDGLVMAGSWEPLLFRVRRGPRGNTPPSLDPPQDGDGYTASAGQRAAYFREHSPEMIARLKALGVNFVMMHCYKGAGMQAEREDMAEAVRFARLCHEAGLRVGVYLDSATLLWEPFFKEVPEADDWVLLDSTGKKQTYGSATYRYRLNRNHPDGHAYILNVIRFAVNEVQTDLVHFDNYLYGPGRDANSAMRFRRYLLDKFTPRQLAAMGAGDLESVEPAMTGPPDNMLRRAWLDFSCQSLADSYLARSRFARTLRSDILIECNCRSPRWKITPPIDHGRQLQGGEAYWAEDAVRPPGYREGKLHTRIRSGKVARRMGNMVFTYNTSPLELAEAMAFNKDCLGCICFFEYAIIRNRPWVEEGVLPECKPFVHFFHARRDLLRDAKVIADAAVLRSCPSQVFADSKHSLLTCQVEQALIENRACFQIIYNQHLDDLSRYRVLVLAGCVALGDGQIEQIRRYVTAGGRLCVVGPVATHDEWMNPRKKPGLGDLPASAIVHIEEAGDLLDAVGTSCEGGLSLELRAQDRTDPIGLCIELTEQPDRRLVHLVNYRSDRPFRDIQTRLRLPAGRRVKSVTLAAPNRQGDIELPFEQKADTVTFSVPEIGVYAIAAVTLK